MRKSIRNRPFTCPILRDGDILVENIEFRGARILSQNGAGIRFDRGRLSVRDCAFIDNQMGILTGNAVDARLSITNSQFSDAPLQQGGLPHLLYVCRIERLDIAGSHFEKGYRGHLIKSRAWHNDIRYNFIVEGPLGEASYEVDLPNGGIARLVGNVIGQGAASQHAAVISFGVEGASGAENEPYLVHNTLISDLAAGAVFLRAPLERFPATPKIIAVNNLTVGAGTFSAGADGIFQGNHPAPPSVFANPARIDFTLLRESAFRGKSTALDADPATRDPDLMPAGEFTWPVCVRPMAPPARSSRGADDAL